MLAALALAVALAVPHATYISRCLDVRAHRCIVAASAEPAEPVRTVEAAPAPPPTAAPAPPVTSPPAAGSGVERWRELVAAYFPAGEVDYALCVMRGESGGDPDAYNASSGASGLMQVLASWADNFGYQPDDLFIPEVNMEISAALWRDGGWGHWVVTC